MAKIRGLGHIIKRVYSRGLAHYGTNRYHTGNDRPVLFALYATIKKR